MRKAKRENGEQESAFCHRCCCCCCFSALTNNTHTQYLCHCSFLCLTTALLLLSLPVLVQHTPPPPRPAPPLICHSLSPDCLSLRVFTITINFDFIIPIIIRRPCLDACPALASLLWQQSSPEQYRNCRLLFHQTAFDPLDAHFCHRIAFELPFLPWH